MLCLLKIWKKVIMPSEDDLSYQKHIEELRRNPELQDMAINPEKHAFFNYWQQVRDKKSTLIWLLKAIVAIPIYFTVLFYISIFIVGIIETFSVIVYSVFSSNLTFIQGLYSTPFVIHFVSEHNNIVFGESFFYLSLVLSFIFFVFSLLFIKMISEVTTPQDRVIGYIFPSDAFSFYLLLPLLTIIFGMILCGSFLGIILRDLYAIYPEMFVVYGANLNPSIDLNISTWSLIGINNIFQPLFLSIPSDLGIGAAEIKSTGTILNITTLAARLVVEFMILKWSIYGFKNMYAST